MEIPSLSDLLSEMGDVGFVDLFVTSYSWMIPLNKTCYNIASGSCGT